jgi:hypothetical protein
VDAQALMHIMQLFYLGPEDIYQLVHAFNHKPSSFALDGVVDVIRNLATAKVRAGCRKD